MRTVTWRHLVAAGASLLGFVVLATVVTTPPDTPEWCGYPSEPSRQALRQAVDTEMTKLQRHSPGQPVDRQTVRLELMLRCSVDSPPTKG